MSDTFLVTGGCGFVGSHIVKELVSQKQEVKVIDDLSRGSLDRIRDVLDKVDFIKGDIRDVNTVSKVMENVDIVIHTAAQVSVTKSIEDPLYDGSVNILGTITLLEEAKKRGVKRFIHFSSAAIYGDPKYIPIDEEHPKNPLSPYGVSKLSSDYYARMYYHLYEVPTVVIRPFNIYGPGQNPGDPYAGVITIFIERTIHNKEPIIYGGTQTRDFVNVKDVVKAVLLAIEKDKAIGHAFNIASGTEITIDKLAEIIIEISGSNLEGIHEEFREGEILRSVANIEKAKQILGYKPEVSLAEGLKEVYNWMKKITNEGVWQ